MTMVNHGMRRKLASLRNGLTRASRALCTVSVALSLSLLIALPAKADLAGELDDMFSNSTTPGSFETSLRQGFSGGGFGVRVPIRNITVISFDPPRFSAGCGGIDFFGGSFSFINSDQLIALLRAIAANAIGVAFKAAIDAINPLLGKIMGDFQQIIQNLNQGLSNTCALASTIVDSAASYLGANETAKASACGEGTNTGGFIDSIACGVETMAASSKNWFNSSKTKTEEAAVNPNIGEVGNLVWKALAKSGVANSFGNPITGETTRQAGKEFLMSLTGTVVVGAPGTNEGATTGEEGYDGNEPPPNVLRKSWTISLRDVRDGPAPEKNGKLQTYKCSVVLESSTSTDTVEDGACNVVTEADAPSDFVGIDGYVNTLFFGSPDGMKGSISPDSIIGKIYSCSNATCSLTAAQQNILSTVQGPALGLMLAVQHDQIALSQIAKFIVPIVANELMRSYAMAMLTTSTQSFDGLNQPSPPEIVKERMASVQEFLNELEAESKKLWQDYEYLDKYVRRIIENDSAMFAVSGRGAN